MSFSTGLFGFDFLRHPGKSFPPIPEPQHGLAEGPSALEELSGVYRQIGYDAGYAQAARDHLESLVATAETVLQEQTARIHDSKDARKLLYAFIARLERRMTLLAEASDVKMDADPEFVDGGLGI